MAKIRQRRKSLVDILDPYVWYLYDTGMIQSTIINSIILVVLALIVSVPHEHNPVKLILSFENIESFIDPESIEPLPEIKISQDDHATDMVSIDIEPVSTEIDINFNDSENIQIASVGIESMSLEDLSQEIKTDPVSDEPEKPIVKKDRSKKVKATANVQNGPFGENIGFGDAPTNNGHNAEVNNIQQRLNAAGAQTGDVQVSIGWNSIDDIDLHVKYVAFGGGGGMINWMNRLDFIGGCLDVDMNANFYQVTNKPVENIFWPKGSSPKGQFFVGIHNFRNWSGQRSVPVTIVIVVDGKKQVFNEVCFAGQPLKEVTRFAIQK
jgi:hypothetical protein